MPMYGYGWSGDEDWWIMAIFMGLFLLGVIIFVVLIVRDTAYRQPKLSQRSSADEILEERFARGEIDEEEFTKRSTALREHRTKQ
ncbi:MAG: SHOCT domain-containing protein [Candidatus Dormibacteria bacterium]